MRGGLNADNPVEQYFVLCEFGDDQELAGTNDNARAVIEKQGATVVTDANEAAKVLIKAANIPI